MKKWTLLGVGGQAEVYAVSDQECVKLFYPNSDPKEIRSEMERTAIVASRIGRLASACLGLTRIGERDGIRMERLCGTSMLHQALYDPQPDVDYGYLLGSIQREYHQASGEGLEDMEQAFERQIGYADMLTPAWKVEIVRRLRRMPVGDRLVHLDYHSDNVMMTATGPRVIDWFAAACGNPLADAARTLMTLEQRAYPADADDAMRHVIDVSREAFREGFLRGYQADVEAIAAWKPFVAAARLCWCPDGERAQDYQMVCDFMEG